MRSAPGVEPEESIAEQDELREILADAIEALTEDEQWIFLMLSTARLSLRFVGGVLGVPKTTLARRRDRIIHKLQVSLLESPMVRERIGFYSSDS
jgi:RNA polymerase sigma factor (sigma-70 family)